MKYLLLIAALFLVTSSTVHAESELTIEDFEQSNTPRRIIFGTILVPMATIAAPLLLFLDVVDVVLDIPRESESRFFRVERVGRIYVAYGSAWWNIFKPIGQGIWIGGKFIVYDVPVAIGKGIWVGGKFIVYDIPVGIVFFIVPGWDPQVKARKEETQRAKDVLYGKNGSGYLISQKLSEQTVNILKEQNQRKVKIELQRWNPSSTLDVDPLSDLPRVGFIPGAKLTELENSRDEFNAKIPDRLKETQDLIQKNISIYEVGQEARNFADQSYSSFATRIAFGAVNQAEGVVPIRPSLLDAGVGAFEAWVYKKWMSSEVKNVTVKSFKKKGS